MFKKGDSSTDLFPCQVSNSYGAYLRHPTTAHITLTFFLPSLYEPSQGRGHGESVLGEALPQTVPHASDVTWVQAWQPSLLALQESDPPLIPSPCNLNRGECRWIDILLRQETTPTMKTHSSLFIGIYKYTCTYAMARQQSDQICMGTYRVTI